VQIAPEDFGKQSYAAIEDNINTKYANKVSDASAARAYCANAYPIPGRTKNRTVHLSMGHPLDI